MVGGLALTFALCLVTAGQFLGGRVPAAFGDALRVDGLSALVLVLCGFVGLLSGCYGVGYLRRNEQRGLVTPRMRREFYGLIPAYVFALLLVSVSNNLGLLWIAVELTTLASVFLVAFHNRDTSLEAAWKFLMLGSLGLGFALLGTVLLFAAGQGHLGEGMSALHWTRFMAAAPELHPFTLRLGVVFALIGYGTKAGLAPMHTWKPDAYREAPSPAVVLMAVGMLNAAMYCLLRIHLISTAATRARILRRPAADARPAVGARRHAVHPDPVEPEAAARLLEHRARRHHGDRRRARRRGGGVRGAAAHDLSHVGQAGVALLGRHARAAPQLVGLRQDRRRHVRPRARRERALRAGGRDDHGLAAVRPVLQRDDDPARRLPRAARGRHRGVPRGADGALLRLRVSGRAGSCWTAARAAGAPPEPERLDLGMATTSGGGGRWPSCPRSICPHR